MDFIKNVVKDKINLLGFIIAFIGAFLLFPNYFESNITPVPLSQPLWMSLDPSWGIALSYVKLKNLIWGTDIAFTYGPLALFCTRAGWGENKFTFLFFDLFMFLNFFLIFFLSFKKSMNKLITTLLIAAVCIIMPLWFGSANSLILMAFLIFWINLSINDPKLIYYFFQIIIITLVFFIKFNTGIIAFPLFYAGIIYNIVSKKRNLVYTIIVALTPLILIPIFCSILNVSLVNYIKSGLEMIKGYNDVMFTENTIDNSYRYSILIAALLTIVLILNTKLFIKEKLLKNATTFLLAAISIFVLFKQSFVRADGGHVYDFFIFIPLLILCNTNFHFNIKKWYSLVILIFVIIIPFNFLFQEKSRPVEVSLKFSKSNYISGFKGFTETSGMQLFPNNSQLPSSVLQKIGNNTVDIFPWNIQLLLLNKLQYHPRPVIQSYTAYTPYLENLNFEHYNSSKAPEFVIYEIGGIDNRYPFFDESKVSLALSKNYRVVETYNFDGRVGLLLQKKSDFKKIQLEKTREYAMILNTPLTPKKDIFYEIEVYNSLLGRLSSIINHSPEINLVIKTKDGLTTEYRTSKLLLETGVFFDKKINETKDFSSIFDNSFNASQEIKYYNFKPINETYFNDKVRITEYKIKQ